MTNIELIARIKAEIERRIEAIAKAPSDNGVMDSINGARGHELMKLLSFLSTLESEKTVPNDLEEAAVEYSAIGYSPFDDPYEKHEQFECSKFAFIAGAKWDREQMMKSALHGWLDEDNEPPYDLNVICEEKIPFGKFKHGDKVRVIICKKED